MPKITPFSLSALVIGLLWIPNSSAVVSQQQITAAQANAFSLEGTLSAVSDKTEDGAAIFDFGNAKLVDDTQRIADSLQMQALKPFLPGIKHRFTLENQTKLPVTISRLVPDCICIQAKIVEGDGFVEGTYVVAPGAKVTIEIGFDYYHVNSGPASAKITVLQPDSTVPLATLIMRGVVTGAVTASTSQIDFGSVAAEAGAEKTFSLSFDRRIAGHMVPSSIHFVTKNPYLKVRSVPDKQEVMGVRVERDTIIFPEDNGDFANDFKLNFKLELLKDAPVGPIFGELGIVIPEYPRFMLLKDVKISIRGEVSGLIRSAPLKNLVLARLETGRLTQSTKIICKAPLRVGDLTVRTSSPFLTASFRPATEETIRQSSGTRVGDEKNPVAHTDESLTDGEQSIQLEVVLSEEAPQGDFYGKITIANGINQETLELPVFAKILASKLKDGR